jgi:hypothetical protein
VRPKQANSAQNGTDIFKSYPQRHTLTMLRNWLLPSLVLAKVRLGCCSKGFPRDCGNVRHVHLAVGPDPSTEMTVSFASTRCNISAPVGGVLIGTSPSELTRVVKLHLRTASTPQKHADPTPLLLTVLPSRDHIGIGTLDHLLLSPGNTV